MDFNMAAKLALREKKRLEAGPVYMSRWDRNYIKNIKRKAEAEAWIKANREAGLSSEIIAAEFAEEQALQEKKRLEAVPIYINMSEWDRNLYNIKRKAEAEAWIKANREADLSSEIIAAELAEEQAGQEELEEALAKEEAVAEAEIKEKRKRGPLPSEMLAAEFAEEQALLKEKKILEAKTEENRTTGLLPSQMFVEELEELEEALEKEEAKEEAWMKETRERGLLPNEMLDAEFAVEQAEQALQEEKRLEAELKVLVSAKKTAVKSAGIQLKVHKLNRRALKKEEARCLAEARKPWRAGRYNDRYNDRDLYNNIDYVPTRHI